MAETGTPVSITDTDGLKDGEEPDELFPTRFAMERSLLVIGDRTEIVLVRHAQQRRSSKESRLPGGPRLSDLGRQQAQRTGEFLAGEKTSPVAVYCSDLTRTQETAQIIAAALGGGLEPIVDAGLREVDLYSRDLGGADVSAEVQARAGQEFGRTLRWESFPNTESSEDFRRRITDTIRRIAQAHPNQKVVLVSHAGAISAAVAGIVDSNPDMFFFAGHASVNRVFFGDDRLVTHSINEVAHLRAHDALTF